MCLLLCLKLCALLQLPCFYYYLFKGLWDRPKGGPSSCSAGNLAHCCHETGEYRLMRNGSCTPHYRTAQTEQVVANRKAALYLSKNEKDCGRKKRAHELCQLPTSLAAFMDQFREGKTYLHFKLNLAKSYKQEASPNYTQRYGNLEDLPNLQH